MTLYLRRITGLLICFVIMINIYGLPLAAAAIISTNQEISIGAKVAEQLEKKHGLVDDAALQARIARIGTRLVAVSERKDLTYSFKVLNSKDVNALAAPGGFVYIFKGLVDYMPSDEELAGVIGHEIGHIVRRHSVKQIEKSLAVSVLFGAAFGDRGPLLQNLAQNAIMAGYSRKDEREADQQGFKQTHLAGYNPYSMLLTLQKLDDLPNKGSYGLFSSHPEPGARVKLVQKYMKDAKITPEVITDGKKAEVVDNGWRLPAFTVSLNGYKPLYRAYFTAGALYLAAADPGFSSSRFTVTHTAAGAVIYYKDQKITTLSPEDAAARGLTLNQLTNEFISKLKEWAPKR
ncbi:M48 family metallopeptidase [Sporomusa termitida]|uniref:Beta-barrel assembly-enhancing protease n=1 Tax=Sporomusa termitida TaxID=2377 RepID=A0A517DNI7_9FIRM|nr:M48 family metallopeptidase [Sporomusa termitida]QDR78935.1 Beta-barrel assembly-enhancing protease [Sporomusa termitida]